MANVRNIIHGVKTLPKNGCAMANVRIGKLLVMENAHQKKTGT